ncbi:uncharacterized protein Pyn_11277 [Prunus yedoensis var. nudiflora]|uniref:Uncharacterized protein n=1 Tax=Prunus yedoensis var. nudiflora TaxID=2094558 RepID=A0A314YH76_PRUYE|nr:uncharacterized protein Pyn_11277 [Prunus yedoensis var. nudiflora]
MTWILGDLFNLFGCMLEPATLYTITTAVLAVQTIYYGCIYPRLKHNLRQKKGSKSNLTEVRRSNTDFVGKQVNHAGRSIGFDTPSAGNVLSSPIPLPGICNIFPPEENHTTYQQDLYQGVIPLQKGLIWHKQQLLHLSYSEFNEEPLLGALASTQSAPSNNIKTVLCVVSLMTLFGTFNHRSVDNKLDLIVENPSRGVVMRVGRRLLQIRKGNVEHYCEQLRLVGDQTNLPWLVDAGGCMLLDIFVSFLCFYGAMDVRETSELPFWGLIQSDAVASHEPEN